MFEIDLIQFNYKNKAYKEGFSYKNFWISFADSLGYESLLGSFS